MHMLTSSYLVTNCVRPSSSKSNNKPITDNSVLPSNSNPTSSLQGKVLKARREERCKMTNSFEHSMAM